MSKTSYGIIVKHANILQLKNEDNDLKKNVK